MLAQQLLAGVLHQSAAELCNLASGHQTCTDTDADLATGVDHLGDNQRLSVA
ncbi:MAG: hypothetical protein ACI88C_000169 [Acidimicrobiales bacterium]